MRKLYLWTQRVSISNSLSYDNIILIALSLGSKKAISQNKTWKLEQFSQVVVNVTLEMLSDVLLVPILVSQPSKQVIKSN